MNDLSLLELEITGRCQLACTHCYASSGTHGTDGTMRMIDWEALIDQAADTGVPRVQFIGGEPTLYPGLPELVRHALSRGLEVEVYSNLIRVTSEMWDLFALPGVRIATSYYSDDPTAHNAITKRQTHHRTRANIEKTLALGIPLRVGVVAVTSDQDIEQAAATLRALGVRHITSDRMRGIGRGARPGGQGVDQLCGLCGDGRMAILPSGKAAPCVLCRWLTLGNVGEADLGTLYQRAQAAHEEIVAVVVERGKCSPDGDGNPGPVPPCNPPLGSPCPPPGGGCPPPRT